MEEEVGVKRTRGSFDAPRADAVDELVKKRLSLVPMSHIKWDSDYSEQGSS